MVPTKSHAQSRAHPSTGERARVPKHGWFTCLSISQVWPPVGKKSPENLIKSESALERFRVSLVHTPYGANNRR